MTDKRRFPRLDKRWQLNYRALEKDSVQNNPIQQFTVNISGGGICFTSEEIIHKGTMLALEMDSEDFASPILALARVAWCRQSRDGYEIGAEFWWIGWQNNDAQQSIADYIQTATQSP